MASTVLSSKGQITLPAALLRDRQLHAGDRLEIVMTGSAIMLVPITDDLVGMLAGSTGGLYGDVATYIDRERADAAETE